MLNHLRGVAGKVTVTYDDDHPIILKEGSVYRSLGDVFEITKLEFDSSDNLDKLEVKVISADDDVLDMSVPVAGKHNYATLTKNDLMPYWKAVKYLEDISLVYFRVDSAVLAHTSGWHQFSKWLGVATPVLKIDTCATDLALVKNELDDLKRDIATSNVGATDVVHLKVSIVKHEVKLETVVSGIKVELFVKVGDTILTQIPVSTSAPITYSFDNKDTGKMPAGTVLTEVKCKILHVDDVKNEVLIEVKSVEGVRGTTVPVDKSLYFWKHLQVLNKYSGILGYGKSLSKKLKSMRGGYTASPPKTRKRRSSR
jgi:hypothetical protein